MSSRKKQDDPWWFSPNTSDVVAIDKVYRRLPGALIRKVLYTMTKARYPTRPKNPKNTWLEPVYVDGANYQLSCRIDENNRKIVVTNIRPPKNMMRFRRRK